MSRAPRAQSALLALASAAVLGLPSGGLVSAQTESPGPQASPRPGPATDKLLFKSVFVDRAKVELEAHNIDMYLYSLRAEAAQQLQGEQGVQLFQAPATALSLILNPAPAPEGQLNPFADPDIRLAMQYLVNRDFIAKDIYGGLARPMITHVAPSDYDFQTVYDIDRGSGIRYDSEYAHQLISAAMTKAGALMVDGKWQFNGQPVQLKLIARVEDERRQVGAVASELKDAGFDVNISLQPFGSAIQSVYSTDPKALSWNLYTEGWGRGAAQRYDDSTINAMNAPWLGNMPGWKEQGFWQFEEPKMDELGQRLFKGQFKSQAERDDLYRQMTQLELKDNVRIWLGSVVNTFPAAADLAGATQDVSAGPRSPWTLRSAHVPGKDQLTIGHLWVSTDSTTWNPIGGFGDVYSVDIWRNVFDPPIANNPFTGSPTPFRADYEVTTAGPDGKMDVPSDAVVWDPAGDRWVPVAAGTQAVSKVTFDYSKYFHSKWHDGQPITMADAVYSIAQGFDIAYDPDKAAIEVALAATSRPYLDTFKGFRLLPDGRLEVYVDYWHFDKGQIAAYASPTSLSMPWEVLAAMDDVVFAQHRAGYSDTAAARADVDWLSLVTSRDAKYVDRTLRQFAGSHTVPQGWFQFGDTNLVTPEEADARYAAAHDWFTAHDHLVISNGPYSLARFDTGAQFAELDAFRDSTYPFAAADYDLGAAPQVAIDPVADPNVTIGADAALAVTVQGPGQLRLRYLFIDPSDGKVLQSGDAEPGATPGAFTVKLGADVTSGLFPGPYQLDLAASSDATALVTERQVDLEVSP